MIIYSAHACSTLHGLRGRLLPRRVPCRDRLPRRDRYGAALWLPDAHRVQHPRDVPKPPAASFTREPQRLESAARPHGPTQTMIMCVLDTSQRFKGAARRNRLHDACIRHSIICKPGFIVMGRWCTHESSVTVQQLWLQPSCAQTAQIGQKNLHMILFPAEQGDAFVCKTVTASCTLSATLSPEKVRTRPTA